MRGQLHTASAAAAIAFVLCLAGFCFVVVAWPPVVTPPPTLTLAGSSGVQSVARAAALVLLLGYLAGIVGWFASLAMGLDGRRWLASVLNGPTPRA